MPEETRRVKTHEKDHDGGKDRLRKNDVGEYVEQKQFYSALIVTAVEADVILLLCSAIDEQNAFSPRMGSLLSGKPVIGVITKTDLCEDRELIEGASDILSMAGAETIIEVGLGDDSCLEELRRAIEMSE